MDSGIGFYDKYISLSQDVRKGNSEAAVTEYKIQYLKELIPNDKVYKFMGLEETDPLTEIRINTLLKKNIWFSYFKTLNDETEFEIPYSIKKVVSGTKYDREYINFFIGCIKQQYDVYSLSYKYSDHMWKDYANDGYGICLEFTVHNYDMLFPIEYFEKNKINFNKMVISALKMKEYGVKTLSILPWVIKNPYNKTFNTDSTKEKEVRILYCPFDDAELNNGKYAPKIKEQLKYRGISKPYSEFGLELSKIIVGDKCSLNISERIRDFAITNEISCIKK